MKATTTKKLLEKRNLKQKRNKSIYNRYYNIYDLAPIPFSFFEIKINQQILSKIINTMKYLQILLLTTLFQSIMTAQIKYPDTRKGEQIDDYHGTKVADPYRWLEDDRSAETENTLS
jgi:hypothetical protein